MSYQTRGKRAVTAFFAGHPDAQYTAETVLEQLPEAAEKPGKSSVYRILSHLCEEGVLRRFRDETTNTYRYQYVGERDCSHHFHLKCVDCGRVYHLECRQSEDLLTHVSGEHGFRIDSGRSLLYGECESCARRRETLCKAIK